MPNIPSFPRLYDECKTISVSDLKRWGYLISGKWKSGTISWSRNGSKTGSISIQVNTHSGSLTNFQTCMRARAKEQPINAGPGGPYLELNYRFNGNPINYRVQLTSVPSNLGKGVVWFFICPHTGRRCRKLYLADTYFYHRSAFRGCFYEKQIQSHNSRNLRKAFDRVFRVEKAFEQIYGKHFKKFYNGEPTKRYLKLLKQIKKGRKMPEN